MINESKALVLFPNIQSVASGGENHLLITASLPLSPTLTYLITVWCNLTYQHHATSNMKQKASNLTKTPCNN